MERFTASNGTTINSRAAGGYYYGEFDFGINSISAETADALREFFRAEEDERLGRWRWAENSDYVVYPWTADPARTARGVTVLSEEIPRGYTVWEDNIDTLYGTSTNEEARERARQAARAYFDAHPEPKPWYDAKPGEVWVIVTRNVGEERAVQVHRDQFHYNDGIEYPLTYEAIESGRRIWPEPSDV